MTELTNTLVWARRATRASYGFVVCAMTAVLVWAGVFRNGTAMSFEHALILLVWAGTFAARVTSRFQEERQGSVSLSLDFELGLLLLVAAHAVVQLAGGLKSNAYPLIYVLIAFVASFTRKPIGALLVVTAVMLEAGIYFITEGQTDVRLFAMHVVFVGFFGLLHLVFTRAEIARVRNRSEKQMLDEREKVRRESRMFRLIATPTEPSRRDEDRLFRSSVEEVHQQIFHTLDLLRRSLELYTCILLFVDEQGKTLRIVELVTESDDIAEGPFPAAAGVVGAVFTRGLVTKLQGLRAGYKGLCYYRAPSNVRAFVGIPVVESGNVRGVLCADRLEDKAFTAREEEILRSTVPQILRTLENERLFVQLEQSKREQTVLYRASQALGAALNADAVVKAGLEATRAITSYDFAAVTSYDRITQSHMVTHAVGEDAKRFEHLSFRDNASLVAMTVANRHYLPYRGEFDEKQQFIFTRQTNLSSMQSVLILPLVVREDVLGTVVLAAHRSRAFATSMRSTLQLLVNHFAVALANAASVRRLEEMATTDALSGCMNKRVFLEELERRIRSAQRFGKQLSLIISDLDHFKAINDTHGHAMGDNVIREHGSILRQMKRETDIVARFGGEEFCVLCEETGPEGALLLAERIRESVASRELQTEQGPLKIHCSLGVATFPVHGDNGQALFEAADKALYEAKHRGRNRVCIASNYLFSKTSR